RRDWRFRPIVAAIAKGIGALPRAVARNARAVVRRRYAGTHRRHPGRCLYSTETSILEREPPARGIAHRRQLADIPDRHPADPRVCGLSRMAAVVRTWRHRRTRMVDDRIFDGKRIE